MKTIAFIIPPTVELLDLAGPVQVFTEAKFYGLEINIDFFVYQDQPVSTSGLQFGTQKNFTQANLEEGDFVFIPGMDQNYVRSDSFRTQTEFFKWLNDCDLRKVSVCSVCNGAFALGHAGLLNDTECATHWRRTLELQMEFPQARVLPDVLYVRNKYVSTSGGISAGIDLALSILEDLTSPHFADKVARGLVVYRRGIGNLQHEGNHFRYRNHVNSRIHDVQEHLINNQATEPSLTELASSAGLSAIDLSRLFKETTGTTIEGYRTWLRQNRNTPA